MISIRHLGKNTNSTQYPQKIEEDATLPNSFYEAHHPDIKAKETALKEKERRKESPERTIYLMKIFPKLLCKILA